tara:strand:- start:2766 stop:4457 length:1692 start_codon:yes stop_codon:yes gene_type:complete
MSLNTLLESANPYQSLQSDAAKLAGKWEKTGLLEGLEGAHKNNMGIILENQAKQLVVESSQTGGGSASSGTFSSQTAVNIGGQWAGVALPLVRKVFGQIAAKEFVSVQPMNLPSGLVFFLDFQYGNNKTPFAAGNSLYGDGSAATNPFGNTATGGLYGAGRFSYSIQSTQSQVSASAVNNATWQDFNYDAAYSGAAAGAYKNVEFPTASLAFGDFTAVDSWQLFSGSGAASASMVTSSAAGAQLSAFTRYDGDASVHFIVPTASIANLAADDVHTIVYNIQPTDRYRGDFEAGNSQPNSFNNETGSNCCPAQTIPEINIQMKSSAIVAKTRKLKAVWTPEFAQDLNAYHALDAEAELTSVLSEYISLEIDLEILSMLIEAAPNREVWSAVNNQAIATDAAGTITNLGFYNSQGQWFQTLGTKIQKLSNIIHQRTLRGGANFMVVSPTVATILESIPGFAADSDGDAAKASYAFGVQKVGAINGRYKVYKNPYMTENVLLLGFRGSQFLESGAVFAPYIPLIMTPLVYDPDTFVPRKGLLTRYAKKMVRPEFYGKIDIAGLNTL